MWGVLVCLLQAAHKYDEVFRREAEKLIFWFFYRAVMNPKTVLLLCPNVGRQKGGRADIVIMLYMQAMMCVFDPNFI